jgi:2-keto-4-pentenoate hydratase/2-oxohepta-3-ene-1,7-dioic acid hydratase in catechol pathway
MRLVTYAHAQGATRAGAFVNDDTGIVDLVGAFEAVHSAPAPASLQTLLGLIEGGEQALEQARELVAKAPHTAMVARDTVKLHAPLEPPLQLRDFSCFEAHLHNAFAAARRFSVRNAPDPEAAYKAADTSLADTVIATFKRHPIYYKCNRFSVVGADQDVIWPAYSKVMDFELEFACYIGRTGKDIPLAEADSYIFGYSIYNDFTARDAQAVEMGGQLGPAKGKDFDTGNVMGPCLVTADEIPNPYNLEMIARVNGEEWGRGTTRDMGWKLADVIAYLSRSETIHAGEVLGSGTVGTGSGIEQMRYLKPNDVVELEVEKLGILRSRIVKL